MKERILRILKNSKKALSEEELKDAIGIDQEEDISIFFFKQKTAYEMCGRDWSSDVCSPIWFLTAGMWLSALTVPSGPPGAPPGSTSGMATSLTAGPRMRA